MNTKFPSPLVGGGGVQFSCSYSLYLAVFTHVLLLLHGLLGAAFKWKPSSYTFASRSADAKPERKPVKVIVVIVALCENAKITSYCALSRSCSCGSVGGGRHRAVIWYLTRASRSRMKLPAVYSPRRRS